MNQLGLLIAEGNTASVYLYNNQIIKLFKDDLPSNEAKREAVKQLFATKSGLPVPRVIVVKTINGKQAIVMDYIYGSTLGDLISEYPNHFKKYLEFSVDLQIRNTPYLSSSKRIRKNGTETSQKNKCCFSI